MKDSRVSNMKALVLSGGTGTRLKPLTNTTTKQLLPVANRPIVFYIMDMVKEAAIKSTGIIVSPQWGEQVKQAMGDGSRWGTEVSYIVQPEPAGLAHAVKTAQSFLGSSPFLMILGDNIYKCDIKSFVRRFEEQNIDALLLLKEVDNASTFGIAELDAEGKVIHVQEKSPEPRSNLALAGIYLFSSAIRKAVNLIKPSQRGELEITDAIQMLIDTRKDVRAYILDGWWLDTGDEDDLLKANRVVLEEFLKPDIRGNVDSKSQVVGKVEVMSRTIIENSIIRGPSSIAEDCLIKDSSVGPFASIGPATIVEESFVENSIVLGNCHIQGIKHVRDSLLGKRVKVVRNTEKNGIISVQVGSDARMEI